jgi:hypothetical protein
MRLQSMQERRLFDRIPLFTSSQSTALQPCSLTHYSDVVIVNKDIIIIYNYVLVSQKCIKCCRGPASIIFQAATSLKSERWRNSDGHNHAPKAILIPTQDFV